MKYWELIAKRLDGTLSSKESADLDAWLQDETNRATYDEVIELWEASSISSEAYEPDRGKGWSQVQNQIGANARRRRFRTGLAVAATLLVIIGIGTVYYLMDTPEKESKQVAREVVLNAGRNELADGSVVWIREGSSITLHRSFDKANRQLRLQGEAYFQVAKDAEHPFTVIGQDYQVQVLGTEFNIEEQGNRVIVAVAEGRVRFSGDEAADTLVANESAILNRSTGGIEELAHNPNTFGWQSGELVFDNMPMDSVILDLNHHFGVEVGVRNQAILQCRFTGKFSNPDIDEVLEIISQVLELKVNKSRSGSIVLVGRGC